MPLSPRLAAWASLDRKNQQYASSLREEGNNFYKQGKYFEALEYYNKCLCFAPPMSADIPLAYGNRSAIYLESKQYQLSLENIQLSRDSGYPLEKIQLLNDREEKCKAMMMKHPTDPDDDPWTFFKLSHPANEKIPFIVYCLELKENKKFGRHIVTNRGNLKLYATLRPCEIIKFPTFRFDAWRHHCY